MTSKDTRSGLPGTSGSAVLFDVDGTLVDSNAMHAESWSAASAEFGFERPASFFRPFIGMGGDRVLPQIAPELNEETSPGKDMAARRGEIFKERFLDQVQPTRGARALVERLHRDGRRLLIATSAQPDELEALLRIVGIESLIEEAAHSEDAEESKPAPDIVTAALRKAGIGAHDAILIGDTRYDIESGAAAGVPTIALRCGGSTDDDLGGAIEIYEDPQDVLDHLGEGRWQRGDRSVSGPGARS